MGERRVPKFVIKRLQLMNKERYLMEAEAREFLKDSERVWNLLYSFRDWFSVHGEMAQCTLFQLKKHLNYNFAMDVIADFDGPWNQVESDTLFLIIKHHGNRKFSFDNMIKLMDCINNGEVVLKNLQTSLLRSNSIQVFIFTMGGFIPYNPLNMHMKLLETTTIKQITHLVKVNFGWPSRDIRIYGSQACEDVLQEDITLKEIQEHNNNGKPETIELYMDFEIGYVDNPLVFSDHYFEGRTVDEMFEDL